jgi:hypothetical protein
MGSWALGRLVDSVGRRDRKSRKTKMGCLVNEPKSSTEQGWLHNFLFEFDSKIFEFKSKRLKYFQSKFELDSK